MIRVSTYIFAALAFLTSASLAAKTYRWVDKNGITVYSQSPPPSGEATEIKPPPPPAVSPEEARRKLDRQRQKLEDLREDRNLKKEEADKAKEEQARLDKNCAAARANLKKLIELPRARWSTKDGGHERPTEEERQKRITEAKGHIKENCK